MFGFKSTQSKDAGQYPPRWPLSSTQSVCDLVSNVGSCRAILCGVCVFAMPSFIDVSVNEESDRIMYSLY